MGRMLNPVHLVLGEDEFLAERATRTIIDAAVDGAAPEVSRLRAGDVTEGELLLSLIHISEPTRRS